MNENGGPIFIIEGGIDLGPLILAHSQLTDTIHIAKTVDEKFTALQHFQTTFELSWKTIQSLFKVRGKDLTDLAAVIEAAAAEKMLVSPECWMAFYENKEKFTHSKEQDVAEDVFDELPLFDMEVSDLIDRLKYLKSEAA